MAGAKKFRLELSDEAPIKLIGILSDESDLKLSWLINKHIGINLSRDEDLNWLSKEIPNTLAFPVYSDETSKYGQIRLLKNQSLEGLWIKGYKQVDYLFLVVQEEHNEAFNELLPEIQKIESVRGAYPLETDAIKGWMV